MGPVRIPLTGWEHLSPGSPSSENLEVLAEKVATLDLKTKEQARKKGLAEAPTRDSALGQPQQGPSKGGPPPESHQTQTLQEPATSGNQTKGKEKLPKCGPSVTGPKLFETRGPHRVMVNGRGGPGAICSVGRQRGPGRLGNQAMPGLLRRASGWLLSVTATWRSSCLRKTS